MVTPMQCQAQEPLRQGYKGCQLLQNSHIQDSKLSRSVGKGTSVDQVFKRRSHEITVNTEFCQGPAELQYSVCREKKGFILELVNCDIMQIISMTYSARSGLDSAASTLDVLQVRLCSSASDTLELWLRAL